MPGPGAPEAPLPGTIFKVGDLLNNTYRIEAVLGRGGTSEVYRARTISGKLVALKVLRNELADDEGFLTLMTREEDIREIRHDAIVPYFHNQRTESGRVFLVMDYVEGPGLDDKMREGGMPAGDLMVLAERVAEGLKAAHARRIVHRDLSPDNIILRGGDPADAVIIDFGIAKDTNPGAQTIVGNEFAGKYAYAAPEQFSGQTDERSDVYALGVVLLAAFCGRSPSEGLSPMETLRSKSQPLDTGGVPEPLKSLIERMTDPDRDTRLQNAAEVLKAIRETRAGPADSTVVARRPAARPAKAPARMASPGGAAGKAPPRRGRGGLIALAAMVLLAAVGAISWFAGVFDALPGGYPITDPYTLTLEQPAGGAPTASGHVPSEEVQAALSERLAAAGGSVDLTLARGEIAEGWGQGVLNLATAAARLEEWRLAIAGNDAELTGMTEDRGLRGDVAAAAMAAAAQAGLTARVEIELGPRILPAERLEPILRGHADCGELTLVDPPPVGYAQGATITVGGQIADAGTEVALGDAIGRIAGDREVAFETRLLNPTLCLVDAALPRAPSGGFEIALLVGASGERRTDGRFVLGEDPVIEVTIPAGVSDGYLYVYIVDVSGKVFGLLPNAFNEENAVGALRAGQDGPVTLRLTHPLAEAEAAPGTLLAFRAAEPLGESRILVLHTAAPILDDIGVTELRAAALAEALAALDEQIEALDSRAFITAAR